MRATLILLTVTMFGCGKAEEPPPVVPYHPVATAPAPAASSAPTPVASAAPSAAPSATASAPVPAPIEKLSTAASTAGWKKLETKLGFAFEYPNKIFTTLPYPTGARLTSKLFVDAPHGVTEKGAITEHRFSARLELRKEDVVAAMKRVVPYAAETGFPKGTVASFTPSQDFLFKTDVAGHEAYVVLWGAHGYGKRTYFVVVDPARTVTVDFDVITDYLEQMMPKAAKMTEQAQIDVADAVVLSLKL